MRRIEGRYLKTDKRPRRQDDQAERGIASVEAEGAEILLCPGGERVGQAEGCRRGYAEEEYDGQSRMEPLQEGLCKDEQPAHGDQHQYGDQCLCEVYVVPGHGVVEPFSGCIGEEGTHDEEQGRPVEEHNGQIGEAQEPGTQKGMVAPECLFGIE